MQFAPEPRMRVHSDAIDWISKFMIGMKCESHHIDCGQPEFTTEQLDVWTNGHRPALVACTGWQSQLTIPHGKKIHEKQVEAVDAIVEAVRRGIAERDPLKYVIDGMIGAVDGIYGDLGVCQSPMIYR